MASSAIHFSSSRAPLRRVKLKVDVPVVVACIAAAYAHRSAHFQHRESMCHCRHPAAALCWPPLLRSEEHTSELQSQSNLVCRLLLEKKKKIALTQDFMQRS